MKLRITPLNIVAAVGVLCAGLLLLNNGELITFKVSGMKTLFVVLFLMLTLVAFVADLIFRKMVPSLKRLWFIELSLITLTVVFVLVIKAIF